MASDPDAPRLYAVRILPRALAEIDQAAIRLENLTDETIAREWRAGLKEELRRLTYAREHPIIPEARHFKASGQKVRQLVYRRAPGTVAYRVLFVVDDEGQDGPTVTVFHVRHSARRPITLTEATRLRDELTP
jgi:hypothetical protein